MVTIRLACLYCKHFIGLNKDKDGYNCRAFEGDIPDSILFSGEHSKVIEGQKEPLVFTQKD